nr:hypothetical protein [uncultured Pedobacter sp.]
MQNKELEEKVMIMEELIQGFITRMTVLETEMPGFLKTFLQQYKETLEKISVRIETANKRYDDARIQQQIDEVSKLVAAVPKVIGVKNSHHFGAWSKSLIIGILICFVITSGSIGAALYLNHQNNRLNREAYNFWLTRALYPDISKSIERNLKEDPNAFIEKAERAMEKQQAIATAQAQVEQATKEQEAAKEKLKKARSGN